jgi:hypothetical protein
LPGLVPGIHALAAEIAKAQEDADGRAKPGQRDLWLCMDRWRQPVSLNRTALGLTRPSLGAAVEKILEAMIAAGGGRFHGIRFITASHPDQAAWGSI